MMRTVGARNSRRTFLATLLKWRADIMFDRISNEWAAAGDDTGTLIVVCVDPAWWCRGRRMP